MEIRYEKKDALVLIGFHTEIRPGEGYRECPAFWEKDYAQRYARLWQTMQPETPLEAAILDNRIGSFAVCEEGEAGARYWIAGPYQGGEVPEGLELYRIPAGCWAVFSTQGPLPGSLQALNDTIWQDWYPREGKARGADGSVTLEVYADGDPGSPDYRCGIWVPVKDGDEAPDAVIPAAVERVREMERLFDLVSAALRQGPERLAEDDCRRAAERLRAYMDSGDWLRDYQLDEAGVFPAELKRGVLSQDGLYDLLTELDAAP
ncbi:MAG: DUF4298 domain-containing protein [Oscillospiraceae bacterium]|nr:DUF4298 domain-containing protein [Oscillospiraceae bacterium]